MDDRHSARAGTSPDPATRPKGRTRRARPTRTRWRIHHPHRTRRLHYRGGGRVTEIHAFDPDGTPSPGAQAALDDAVAGLATTADLAAQIGSATEGLASEGFVSDAVAAIPDASTESRGMMTATAAGAIADLPSALTATEDAAIAASRVPAMFTYGTTGGHRYSHFRTFAGRPTPGL